jgi:hypothetical protein
MAQVVITVCDRCRAERPPYRSGIGGYYCRRCFPIIQQVPNVAFGPGFEPTETVSLSEALRINRKEMGFFGMAPEFVEALPPGISGSRVRLRGVCSILLEGSWNGNGIDEAATRLGLQLVYGNMRSSDSAKSVVPPGMVEAALACQIEDALQYLERWGVPRGLL